jgi:hypothetical protein
MALGAGVAIQYGYRAAIAGEVALATVAVVV